MEQNEIEVKIKELLVWGYRKSAICKRLSIRDKDFDATLGVLFFEYKVDNFESLVLSLMAEIER